MRKFLTKGIIVLVFGLVLSAFTGISAGQDSGGKVSTGPEGIITNMTNPEIISGYSALPALATAEFKIFDCVEINVDKDIIPSGTLSGRQWGSLQIINIPDSSRTVLGNISETVMGDSFIQVEYPENATWNSTYIHWIFPPDFVLNEEIDWRTNYTFFVDYHTSALTPFFNPVTLTRYVNKSIFLSDGHQFNSYEVNFEENMYEGYTGKVAYFETMYTNSSILFDTFTTDLPLTYQTNKSYHDPITKQYISELNFGFNNSSIQLHRPYHFNVTAAIKLTDNAGSPVKSYPRIFFSLDHTGPVQQGDVGMTAIMPSPLLPAHLTSATATTNVSNLWQYRHRDQLKMAFNQTAEIIEQEKIGVVRNNKTWILDASGNGAYGAGDLTYTFGITGDRYVTGDWNGNGTTKIGVVRNNKTWILDATGNGAYGAGDLTYTFGKAGDVYVTGDWTGTGTTRIGVVRSNTTWLLDASGDGKWGPGDFQYVYGKAKDVYVTGDWNNDRKTEIGVVRNNKTWILDASGDGKYGAGDLTYTFGTVGDRYVTGDWAGNGTTRIGVVRFNTTWLLDASGNGLWGPGDYQYTFGKAGDKYVTGKWN